MSGETEKSVSGWTVDTLHTLIIRTMDERDRRYSERAVASETAVQSACVAQTTAMNAAFAASEKAVSVALAAAEKAVNDRAEAQERMFHERLEQYRHEVELAFTASDRAITKAELATEKRFESVNEFRAQLSDQAARFMPRGETESMVSAVRGELDNATGRIQERLTEMNAELAKMISRTEAIAFGDRNAERIQEVADRLNKSEGRGNGLNAGWIYILGVVAAMGTIVSLFVILRPGG